MTIGVKFGACELPRGVESFPFTVDTTMQGMVQLDTLLPPHDVDDEGYDEGKLLEPFALVRLPNNVPCRGVKDI